MGPPDDDRSTAWRLFSSLYEADEEEAIGIAISQYARGGWA